VNFHAETLALMGVGLMLASVCADSRATDARAPHIVWWVLAILPIPWLQYQLNISLFAGDALIVSLYLCALAAAVWLGFCYASGETEEPGKQLISVFYVLWIAALASAAIGLLQWLSLEGVFALYLLQTDAGDRAMGNLGQPNQLATLLLMGMAALAWTYERKRIGACAMVLGIAFLTLVLVLTQSRAGMLSAGAVAAFLVWKHLASPGRIAPKSEHAWAQFGLSCLETPCLARQNCAQACSDLADVILGRAATTPAVAFGSADAR